MLLNIRVFLIYALSCGLMLTCFCVQAWDSSGHKIIAFIAYQHLTPQVKAKVNQLTAASDADYPPLARFFYAAVWPDMIRERKVDNYKRLHYINIPYTINGVAGKPPRRKNIVWGIKHFETILTNPKKSLQQRSIALRFVVHFVGDAHQPLHCITLYSSRFPYGDAGGNLYPIKSGIADNLHQFWDKGLGLFLKHGVGRPLSKQQIRNLSLKIEHRYPPRYFGKRVGDLNPNNWVRHSYDLAKAFTYHTPIDQRPSQQYIKQGQKIVQQQLAIAGYQLAKILNNGLSVQHEGGT